MPVLVGLVTYYQLVFQRQFVFIVQPCMCPMIWTIQVTVAMKTIPAAITEIFSANRCFTLNVANNTGTPFVIYWNNHYQFTVSSYRE